MTLDDMKIAVVMAWALIWSVIAVSLATSVGNWVLVVGVGVLPSLMILRMWQRTPQTVPAGIREARR
jgi:tetrahydromethanopterin S-methyltransferase subunit D